MLKEHNPISSYAGIIAKPITKITQPVHLLTKVNHDYKSSIVGALLLLSVAFVSFVFVTAILS